MIEFIKLLFTDAATFTVFIVAAAILYIITLYERLEEAKAERDKEREKNLVKFKYKVDGVQHTAVIRPGKRPKGNKASG